MPEVQVMMRSPVLTRGSPEAPTRPSGVEAGPPHASRARLLFPTATPSRSPAWLIVVGYVAALAVLSGAALLRQPGVPATTTVWAEDGLIYYAQAMRLSFWQTLAITHNGYAQLFPRLAVQVARLFPVADASTVFALMGALSVAGVACFVFHVAKGHIVLLPVRGLLAAAVVLLPVANTEMLNNLVNVPWWLFFAAFWALLWRPRSLSGRVGRRAGVFLGGRLATPGRPVLAFGRGTGRKPPGTAGTSRWYGAPPGPRLPGRRGTGRGDALIDQSRVLAWDRPVVRRTGRWRLVRRRQGCGLAFSPPGPGRRIGSSSTLRRRPGGVGLRVSPSEGLHNCGGMLFVRLLRDARVAAGRRASGCAVAGPGRRPVPGRAVAFTDKCRARRGRSLRTRGLLARP